MSIRSIKLRALDINPAGLHECASDRTREAFLFVGTLVKSYPKLSRVLVRPRTSHGLAVDVRVVANGVKPEPKVSSTVPRRDNSYLGWGANGKQEFEFDLGEATASFCIDEEELEYFPSPPPWLQFVFSLSAFQTLQDHRNSAEASPL